MKYLNITNKLEINPETREWCRLPYGKHTNGCRNRDNPRALYCPLNVPMIDKVFDLDEPHYFVYQEFYLFEYIEDRKKNKPKESNAQLRNVLWWQNKERKLLKIDVINFLNLVDCNLFNTLRTLKSLNYGVTLIPEAMGIDVFKTCEKFNLILERKYPLKIVRKIAFVGKLKKLIPKFIL